MKQVILALLLTFPVFTAHSQTTKKEPTCFEQYKKEFDERGAYVVDDGRYTGVIISIVTAQGTDCVYGKVAVEGGHVINIWLQYEDNSYDFLDRKYKNANSKVRIVNGITEPLYSTQDETIYVIFVDKIKPRKKQLKKAAGPQGNF